MEGFNLLAVALYVIYLHLTQINMPVLTVPHVVTTLVLLHTRMRGGLIKRIDLVYLTFPEMHRRLFRPGNAVEDCPGGWSPPSPDNTCYYVSTLLSTIITVLHFMISMWIIPLHHDTCIMDKYFMVKTNLIARLHFSIIFKNLARFC